MHKRIAYSHLRILLLSECTRYMFTLTLQTTSMSATSTSALAAPSRQRVSSWPSPLSWRSRLAGCSMCDNSGPRAFEYSVLYTSVYRTRLYIYSERISSCSLYESLICLSRYKTTHSHPSAYHFSQLLLDLTCEEFDDHVPFNCLSQ